MKLSEIGEMKEAVEVLKDKLKSPPMLPIPDFDVPVIMETDPNIFVTGAVLVKKKKTRRHNSCIAELLGLYERSFCSHIRTQEVQNEHAFNRALQTRNRPSNPSVCLYKDQNQFK